MSPPLRSTVRRKSRIRTDRGLTFIEILIAVFIVTPILIILMRVFLQNVRGVTESWDETKAITLAQGLMDRIRTMKWDELTSAGGTIPTTSASSPLGPDAGELLSVDYDDVDDWNGYDLDPATADFRRSVTVDYVEVDAAGTVTLAAGRSDFKRVTVKVMNRGGKPLVISVIFTNSFP